MIGKPAWFKRRKYTGWGISPKTWQGWVYIGVTVGAIIFFSQVLPDDMKRSALGILLAIIIVDCIDIWFHLKMDEREKQHEAIAERNAAWFMSLILAIGLAFDAFTNAMNGIFYFNPFIALALFGAVFVKGATNFYLDRRN